MKKTIASTLCLAAVLTACQTTPPNRFDLADKNKDGQLSRDEISDYLVTGLFKSRDANKDGKMTEAEWIVPGDEGAVKIFRDRDANKDGIVTLDEALAYGRKKGIAKQIVQDADTSKDGTVSREEATAYYASKEGSVR